jgi:hypothetical protein
MTILSDQPPAPFAEVPDDISQHPEDCTTGELIDYIRTSDHGNPHPDDTDLAAVLAELMGRHHCSTSDQLTPLIMGDVDDDSAITPRV